MSTFRIIGQQPLAGELTVRGSKNSATKLLAATVLTSDPCTLTNIPRVEDVHRIVDLLIELGAVVSWPEEHTVTITTANIDPSKITPATVRKLRSSIVLLGALLGRQGEARLPSPGGDQIGARPMDAHLRGFERLGVEVSEADGWHHLKQGKRGDITFTMPEFSVTATENVILACVRSAGCTTTIHCAAADPSVQDLCWFLTKLGASIDGIGSHTLTIHGVAGLHGCDSYSVMPDPVEAGTFICLAAAARAPLRIRELSPDFLGMEFEKFREVNVAFSIEGTRRSPTGTYDLADVVMGVSSGLKAIRAVHNMPFPGFSADLLPPFAVMLTQASGTSLVHDWMYEGRLKYVEELNKMGANIFIADPHRILVSGPTNLYGTAFTNYDIRTGATGIIAGLIASGTTTLGPAYQLDRGYEHLDERLRGIGANIQREETPTKAA